MKFLTTLGFDLAHLLSSINTLKKFTTPMMMINAFYDRMCMVEEQGTAGGFSVGALFGICFLFYFILIALSLLLALCLHPPKKERNLYIFMTIFGNVGFMGFPVVQSVFGTEGLFYAAILNSVFNIFVYTFGVVLMGGAAEAEGGSFIDRLRAIPYKKLLLTPAVLCTAVGVLIFIFRIHLPGIIADSCETLGGLTSPIAMMVVGANLNGLKIKDLITDPRMNIYVCLRQLAVPLIFWLIIRLLVHDAVLAPTLLLLSCMPVANTTALFATEYGGNEALASQGIFLTTLFSLVSFPLLIWVCVR